MPLPRWCLTDASTLTWRSWDGEIVIHHALSNDTHRLSEPAGRVLSTLAEQGAQNVGGLASTSGLDQAQVEDVLTVLDRLSLTHRC